LGRELAAPPEPGNKIVDFFGRHSVRGKSHFHDSVFRSYLDHAAQVTAAPLAGSRGEPAHRDYLTSPKRFPRPEIAAARAFSNPEAQVAQFFSGPSHGLGRAAGDLLGSIPRSSGKNSAIYFQPVRFSNEFS